MSNFMKIDVGAKRRQRKMVGSCEWKGKRLDFFYKCDNMGACVSTHRYVFMNL